MYVNVYVYMYAYLKLYVCVLYLCEEVVLVPLHICHFSLTPVSFQTRLNLVIVLGTQFKIF